MGGDRDAGACGGTRWSSSASEGRTADFRGHDVCLSLRKITLEPELRNIRG
jgi:hypothetical protein